MQFIQVKPQHGTPSKSSAWPVDKSRPLFEENALQPRLRKVQALLLAFFQSFLVVSGAAREESAGAIFLTGVEKKLGLIMGAPESLFNMRSRSDGVWGEDERTRVQFCMPRVLLLGAGS